MDRNILWRRNFIVSSISVLTIGGVIALSQHDTKTTRQKSINTEINKLNIVHCWQEIPSSTRVRCKYVLNKCAPTWTEGYPPPPKQCP
jgi:hypothetical protein